MHKNHHQCYWCSKFINNATKNKEITMQSQRRWASQQNSRNASISQCRVVSDNIAMCLYKCIGLRITYGMAIARMITIRMFYFKLCIFFIVRCVCLYVFSCTIHCNSFVNLLNNKQRAHTHGDWWQTANKYGMKSS